MRPTPRRDMLPNYHPFPRHDVFSNRMAIKVQRSGAAGQAKQRRGKPDKPEQLSTHRVEAPAPAQAASKQPQQQAERWSKPFSIEVIDTDGVLRVGGYELGIGIQAAPEPAVLTKVITFAPRYILRNRLRVGVAYRQHGTSEQACRYLGLQPPTHRVAGSTASTAPRSKRATQCWTRT